MSRGDNGSETKSRWATVCQETLRRARRHTKQQPETKQKPLEKKKSRHLRAPWKKAKAPGSPRRRTSLACERCRKRKIKCTGEAQGAPCENCRGAGVTHCRFIRMGRTEEFLVELTLPDCSLEPPANASPGPPNPEPLKPPAFSTTNLANPSSDSLPMPPPFSSSFAGYCHSYPENSSSTSLASYSDYAPSPIRRSTTPGSRRPTTSPRPHTALPCVPELDLKMLPPLTPSSSSSVDLSSMYPPGPLENTNAMPPSPGVHEQMLSYIPENSPLPQLPHNWQLTSPPSGVPLGASTVSPVSPPSSFTPSFSPPNVRSASPVKRDPPVRAKNFNPGPTPLKTEFLGYETEANNVSPAVAGPLATSLPLDVASNNAISPACSNADIVTSDPNTAPITSSYLQMQSLPITPPADYGPNMGYPVNPIPPHLMTPAFYDPWKQQPPPPQQQQPLQHQQQYTQPMRVQPHHHRHINLHHPAPFDYCSPLDTHASFSSPPQEFCALSQSPPPSRYANYHNAYG